MYSNIIYLKIKTIGQNIFQYNICNYKKQCAMCEKNIIKTSYNLTLPIFKFEDHFTNIYYIYKVKSFKESWLII